MKSVQTSESIKIGIILAICGGFMDVYSYIMRGGVFANAETGNIVLLALNIGRGEFFKAGKYLIPILAFTSGVLIADIIKKKKQTNEAIHHWRQITVFIEILALCFVAFIPSNLNHIANSLISLTCGIQIVSFAKIRGTQIATTMCTGNLRNGTQNLSEFFNTGNREFLKKSAYFYGCILFFMVGAVIGSFFIGIFKEKAILVAAGFLTVVYIMMFFNKGEKGNIEKSSIK